MASRIRWVGPLSNRGGVLHTLICFVPQNISHFYPPGSLKPIAERIVRTGALTQIAQSWHLPYELAMDLARLALFDIALLLDDSASMQFFENGVRIDELRMMVGKIATAAGLFDSDGIEVRWLNSKKEGNGFTTEAQVVELIGRVKWDRATPLGTAMKHKILEPLVYKKIKKNALKKPLLIISVTDGAPTAEPRDEIVKVRPLVGILARGSLVHELVVRRSSLKRATSSPRRPTPPTPSLSSLRRSGTTLKRASSSRRSTRIPRLGRWSTCVSFRLLKGWQELM